MTKPVRKSARLTSTMLGGVGCVPSALRRNDSTTMMRVNEVTVMRIAGARLSTVSSTRSWTMWPVEEPPSPRSSVTVCASGRCGGEQSRSSAAAADDAASQRFMAAIPAATWRSSVRSAG